MRVVQSATYEDPGLSAIKSHLENLRGILFVGTSLLGLPQVRGKILYCSVGIK